ncbi:PhoX family protein [Mangrovimonas spongiae]|uniref:Phosphatase n=1 Tax=Mangrovimonas spongiae TaxID=2494697 RepID=A0A3R9NLB3_9FLAO|nr:phosphatase [Mangrovimonas spongiae]RSK38551.1 phosphatase [Mangrovimonas spongiae]
MNNIYKLSLGLFGLLSVVSCNNDDDNNNANNQKQDQVKLESHSQTPVFLELTSDFSDVNIYNLLTSEDQLVDTPEFVYGSMADGAGLMRNGDDTFTLINNIEADYSIARITLDKTFKPVAGEYILNASASASTAQCSGSLITPEEHGFGPIYLSGGEWGGASKGVFATDPFKGAGSASVASLLPALGQWSTENAVAIGKDAYPNQTVVFIGDDHSDNTVPSGQLGMYVGAKGDLNGGQLYGLRVTDPSVEFEMDMNEGQSYPMEFVQLDETQIDLLDAECKDKGVMGFSRLEDIDWRRGSAENNREIYFCVTGRSKPDLAGKGSFYGRVYKVTLNPNDPTAAGTITCVLDGDNLTGIAKDFHSPDNIVVTENYAYIQEDPNGYFDTADKTHYARLYQYNLNTGELKTVLECDQVAAEAQGYGTSASTWEITGMIDVSDIIGKDNTFLVMTQNHGWEPADGSAFTDPNANPAADSRKEGSMLYIVEGLER